MAKSQQVRFQNKAAEKTLGISAAVQFNGTVYLSEITAVDEGFQLIGPGDFTQQLEYVYEKLNDILNLNHISFENVLSETFFVTELQQFRAHTATRTARYRDCCLPAITAVQVQELAYPGCMIALQVVACAAEHTGLRL